MKLQNTQGNNFFGFTVDVTPQSVKIQKTHIVQAYKLQQTSVQTDIKTFTAALGLPADKLSASIISFARFFSLPLNKELLTDIRRQAIAPQLKSHNTANKTPDNNSKTPSVKTSGTLPETPPLKTSALTAAQSRTALALAGADSKGVKLTNEALQNYSAAINPDAQQERQSKDRKKHKREDDGQTEQNNKVKPLSTDEMKRTALESMADNPLLNILNNLPDSNGKRWIVLPFEYDENGKLFKVSLRFFLEQDKKTVKQMVVDIAEAGNRWVFIVNNDKNFKLTLYVEPHLSDTQLMDMETELSRGLNINLELVKVNNKAVDFPFEADSEENPPLSINEAV